jgi:uncharacterized membrane protein required for colicin V production
MWMANLAMLLIITGCAAYQYLKGTFVKAFATIIIAICASVVAFGYFEPLAELFLSHSDDSSFDSVVPWAQPLSFVLLFVLAFAILQTVVARLLSKPIDLGFLPERIGRVICGVFLGLILSGLLLTALAMAPLPNQYPYQRFDADSPDPDRPGTVLLNADGFATGWFSLLSGGSFSGKKSFAALHPAFLNQSFLNRHKATDDVPIINSSQAIEVPSRKQKAVWTAPEGLKDSVGKPVPQKPRHSLTIVRVGIKKQAGGNDPFTMSQVRLICKEGVSARDPFVGKAKNVYPVGYMRTADRLLLTELGDSIALTSADFDGPVKWIDFAFYVPNDFQPVFLQFKQNGIALLPPPASAQEAPPPASFVQMSRCPTDSAELQPLRSARLYGVKLTAGPKFLGDLTVRIDDPDQWRSAQTTGSIKHAQWDNGKVTYVRAELNVQKLSENKPAETGSKSPKRPKRSRRTPRRPKKYVDETKGISKMLKPLRGYDLLSLSCNRPSTGAAISAEQLPVLLDLSDSVHHPVGVIASGKVDDLNICEVDYCSLTAEQVSGGLTIAEDGSVAKPFPDNVWLTERAEKITEFYVLYLVKSGRNTIITAVQPADSKTPAAFRQCEGLLVK